MIRISIYIVRQIIPWMFLALAVFILAFLTTQSLRVAPVFVGAGAGVFETVFAIGLLSVPVASWALTPAFVVAVFSAAGQMAKDGELVALDASGLNRRWLFTGPVTLALLVAFVSLWLWLDAAPHSQAVLRSYAVELAGRALAGRIEAGQFARPLRGITFFADHKDDDGVFRGVVLEDARYSERPVQFVAEMARIETDSSHQVLAVHFGRGTAFVTPQEEDEMPVALTFQSLDLKVPLAAEIENRLDFLPSLLAVSTSRLMGPPPPGIEPDEWHFALWRRVAGPLGFVVLALFSIGLGFGTSWTRRGKAVALAALLFLLYHLLCRLGESLMQAEFLSGYSAALLPVAAVALALLVFLVQSFWYFPKRQ